MQSKIVFTIVSGGRGLVKMPNAQFNDKILGQKSETQVEFNGLTTPH